MDPSPAKDMKNLLPSVSFKRKPENSWESSRWIVVLSASRFYESEWLWKGDISCPSFKLQHYPKNKRLSVVRHSATTRNWMMRLRRNSTTESQPQNPPVKFDPHLSLWLWFFERNFFLTPLLILHPTKELIVTTLNANPPNRFQHYISIMFRTRVSEVYIVSNEQLHIFWREMVVEDSCFSSTNQVFRLQHAFVAASPISCRITSFRTFGFSSPLSNLTMDFSFSHSRFALNENNNLLEPKQTKTNNSLENNARAFSEPSLVLLTRANEFSESMLSNKINPYNVIPFWTTRTVSKIYFECNRK